MKRLFIANRGEIAVRIIRACFEEGIESVLGVSAADTDSLAARLADHVVLLGDAPAQASYLNVDKVVEAAVASHCDALHPGYGFLSERTTLVNACEGQGITFVGPPSLVMERSGDKLTARAAASSVGIPVGTGSAALQSVDDAISASRSLNYPLLLKASAGGGGKGMSIIRSEEELPAAFARSSSEAERSFGDGTVYLEPYIERARHVEVQILADKHGNVRHLGERDCSTQRRYQKIIEEAPAPGLSEDLLARMRQAAVDLATALGYIGAGTVEFLVDVERNAFIFLEVNARVQVEHPVTEAITGVDIVREQIRIARGEIISFLQSEIDVTGHAIECRINAEDPSRGFLPTPGTITQWTWPQTKGLRIDTFAFEGAVIPPYYDSLVAKVIVHAPTRREALDLIDRVLAKAVVRGISTTIPLHRAILNEAEFQKGPVTTKWLEETFLRNWSQSP